MLSIDARLRRGEFDLDVRCDLAAAVTGVFGPSGAGKTTLLHLLAGLLRPDTGRVALRGRAWIDTDARLWTPPHRRRIGVVFQDGRLLPHYRVRGNLLYGARDLPRARRRRRLAEIAELLDVNDLLDRRPAELSGGQRRRVALGRALLAEPQLLLLDEPLIGLDWRLKAQILPYLHRVRETLDTPIVYVSHQLDEVLQLADELVLLSGGRVVGTGTHLELLERPRCGELLCASGMTNPLSLRVVQHWHGRGMTALEAIGPDGEARLNEFGRPVIVRAPLRPELAPGSDVRIALDPEDIAVASAPVEQISIQNQLPARVRRVFVLRGRVLCLLDAGVPLLAGITHQSCRELQLRPGRRVWAMFKTQAIDATACVNPRGEMLDAVAGSDAPLRSGRGGHGQSPPVSPAAPGARRRGAERCCPW